MNLYNNIEYCIKLLFNAIYTNDDRCYILNPINRKDIAIDNLRKPLDYSCEEIFKNGSFKLMGKYNQRICYKRTHDKSSVTVSIGMTHQNQNSLDREELQHMAMLYMCSEIIFNEKFNHFMLPILSADIDKEELLKLFPTLIEDYPKVELTDKLYIIITEHYFNMINLQDFLEEIISSNDVYSLKVLLFQILVSLIKLSERFQNFSHQNLNLDSIFVYKKNPSTNIYHINTMTFEIKECTFDIKITDFDKSVTTDYNYNSQKNISIYNPNYDLFMIYSLIYGKINDNLISKIDKSINNFFIEILPIKYRNKNYNLNTISEDKTDFIINLIDIIKKNKFFKNFIRMDLSVSSKELKIKKISELNSMDNGINYNNSKKKSNHNYMSIKGSRKLVIPGFNNSMGSELSISSVSEGGGIFLKATGKKDKKSTKSKKSIKSKVISEESITVPANGLETSQEKKKSSSSKSSSSSEEVKDKDLYLLARSDKKKSKTKKSKLSSVSSSVISEQGRMSMDSRAILAAVNAQSDMWSSKKDSKKKKSRKVATSSSYSTVSMSEGGASHRSSRQSQHSQHSQVAPNPMLKPEHQSLLSKLPASYVDLAPESLTRNMPSLDGYGMQMPMQQQQQQLQPQDMSQLAALSAYPQMPQNMGPNMGQNMGNNFNSQLNVPMMSQGMNMGMPPGMGMNMGMPQGMGMNMGMPPGMNMGMQMGGGSTQMKKYKLSNDILNLLNTSSTNIKNLTKSDAKSDFFF
jgi:hypothetical protein